MARNIGQRLLNDPEIHKLGVVGQPTDILGNLDVDLNVATFSEPLDGMTEGEAKTCLVEIGRMQKVGDGAKLAAGLFEIVLKFVKKRCSVSGHAVLEASGNQACGNQVLTRAVMQ